MGIGRPSLPPASPRRRRFLDAAPEPVGEQGCIKLLRSMRQRWVPLWFSKTNPAGLDWSAEKNAATSLVHDYEEKKFPIDKPDPVAAICFRMEQQGLAPRDLVPFLGSRSQVSEVLSGKRGLSLKMIRALVAGLRIPAELLLGEPGRA